MFASYLPSSSRTSAACDGANGAALRSEIHWPHFLAVLLFAILTTSASLGIAAYAGWHRGGMPVERAMNIVLGSVAVLYVHLLPIGWNALRGHAKVSAFTLWCVSLLVVLYGQVSFFMVSQQHAGDQRAETVPIVMPLGSGTPTGRTLTEIAQEAAKVRVDMARAEVRRCISDCLALQIRKMTLAAQLATLETEAGEAKRRETEEDRRNEHADRNEALRTTLRADPIASLVAPLVGTTEGRLELALGVACAVVLEGAAIIGWLLASVASGNVSRREAVVSGRDAGAPVRETIALEPGIPIGGRTSQADDHAEVARGQAPTIETADRLVASEDDRLLMKIHDAV